MAGEKVITKAEVLKWARTDVQRALETLMLIREKDEDYAEITDHLVHAHDGLYEEIEKLEGHGNRK